MLISYKWLNKFVDTGLPVDEMGHALTMAGLEIEGIEAKGDDHVLEVNVTPNRADCLSALGIARELRAISGNPMSLPEHAVTDTGSTGFKIEILDPGLCNRYAGRVVRGVKVGPSPDWMRERLEKCGIRSINNIVDITNFVLLEFGHPLHAFDLATLKGGLIKVGVAGKGRTIRTLDDLERKLPEDALLIWDAERPVAIAGVMGGADTEVSESTTDIFIESAWFLPASVRKTSKSLGLSTEASYRFERGTDIEMLEAALDRTARLVAEIAGGSVEAKVDSWPVRPTPEPIKARCSYINRLLGTNLTEDDMLGLLRKLDLEIKHEGDIFYVTPPPYRLDMDIEADMAEEVARLYGYDNIQTHAPIGNIDPTGGEGRERKLLLAIKSLLNASGFHDAINYSFMNEKHLDILSIPGDDDRRKAVRVANPLRAEDALMRTMLIPALISNLAYNIARGAGEVKLFEAAKVFMKRGDQLPDEPHRIGGAYFSRDARSLYQDTVEPFFVLKGVVESLFDMLRAGPVDYRPSGEAFFHPGKCTDIFIGGKPAGFIGVLSDAVKKGFDIKVKEECAVFELDLDIIMAAVPLRPVYRPIPRYPVIERDVALLLNNDIEVSAILGAVRENAPELYEGMALFDCYTGKGVPEGKRSLAFNIVYRSTERTLTDEEVDAAHQGIVDMLVKSTGAEVRGA